MKLWIIGAEGLLGKTLQQACRDRRIPVVASSRLEADVTQLDRLRAFARTQEGITHLVNCAALTNVDAAEAHPERAYAVNGAGPENVALVARERQIKVTHISTDYVFDGTQRKPYTEECPCNPISVYGKSKLEGEKKLLSVLPDACILRTSWLFGLGGAHFFSFVLQKMQAEERLQIVADQRGKPTFARDVAEVLLDLLGYSGVFHFANAGIGSRFEVAKTIYKKAQDLNLPLKCKEIEPIAASSPIRPLYSALATEKIERLLGKAPRHWELAFHDYLAEAYAL